MKTTRRDFFKVVAGGLGYLSLAAIFIPFRPSFAQIKPKVKHPKDVLCSIQPMPGKKRKFSDRNWVCRSYVIRQEFTVNPVWNSVKEFGCDKCIYEETCLFSGTKITNNTHKTRTFMPEMWSKKLLNEFTNIFFNTG